MKGSHKPFLLAIVAACSLPGCGYYEAQQRGDELDAKRESLVKPEGVSPELIDRTAKATSVKNKGAVPIFLMYLEMVDHPGSSIQARGTEKGVEIILHDAKRQTTTKYMVVGSKITTEQLSLAKPKDGK